MRRRATADEASALASGAKLLFLQFFNDWVFNIYEYILISCFTCQLPVFPRVQGGRPLRTRWTRHAVAAARPAPMGRRHVFFVCQHPAYRFRSTAQSRRSSPAHALDPAFSGGWTPGATETPSSIFGRAPTAGSALHLGAVPEGKWSR